MIQLIFPCCCLRTHVFCIFGILLYLNPIEEFKDLINKKNCGLPSATEVLKTPKHLKSMNHSGLSLIKKVSQVWLLQTSFNFVLHFSLGNKKKIKKRKKSGKESKLT